MPLVASLYVAILIFNLHESERRSLRLREAQDGDRVSVSIRVMEANLNRSELECKYDFGQSEILQRME